jgi:hypothetical protein
MYLIIDEISIVSRKFFARLSAYIAKGKSLARVKDADRAKNLEGLMSSSSVTFTSFHPLPVVGMLHSTGLAILPKTVVGRKVYGEFPRVVDS